MDRSVTLGRWRATIVDAGRLFLDGGAMFGSVPRVVWERCIEPDDQHRIPLATRLLLLEDSESDRIVVIDAGVGDKEEASFRERFAVSLPEGSGEPPLCRAIRAVGVDPAAITDLILAARQHWMTRGCPNQCFLQPPTGSRQPTGRPDCHPTGESEPHICATTSSPWRLHPCRNSMVMARSSPESLSRESMDTPSGCRRFVSKVEGR